MGKRVATIKPTPLSVIGEILITAGAILMLYVVWQLFINDPAISAQQEQTAKTYVQPNATPDKPFADAKNSLKQGKVFGKLYIPRFSKTYERLIGQGTFQNITLNKSDQVITFPAHGQARLAILPLPLTEPVMVHHSTKSTP